MSSEGYIGRANHMIITSRVLYVILFIKEIVVDRILPTLLKIHMLRPTPNVTGERAFRW